MLPAEQVVDDLEPLAGPVVDRRGVGQHEVREIVVVTQGAEHVMGARTVDLVLDGVLVGPQIVEVSTETLGQHPDERAGRDGRGQRTSPSHRVRCGPRST